MAKKIQINKNKINPLPAGVSLLSINHPEINFKNSSPCQKPANNQLTGREQQFRINQHKGA